MHQGFQESAKADFVLVAAASTAQRKVLSAVYLPFALERKYLNANREWKWQYVFPAKQRSINPRNEIIRRHHLNDSALQRSLKQAVRSGKIDKIVSCHTLRQGN